MWKEIKESTGNKDSAATSTTAAAVTKDSSSSVKSTPVKAKSPIWDEDIDAFLNSPETGNTPNKATGKPISSSTTSSASEGTKTEPVDIQQFLEELG